MSYLGRSSRGNYVRAVGIDNNNNAKATDVIGVARAVGDLTVSDKGDAAPALTAAMATTKPVQQNLQFGQEGRV